MSSKSIAFVDSRVANYQSFIDSLTEPFDVFILDGDKDGLDQMAGFLKGRSGLDAIHLVSHGSQGAIYLGSTVLNSGSLVSYQSQLATIGSSLTDAGDILLYGCNVAQGESGLQFINSLAQYTGADVAASSNSTGSAALGGDFELEMATGSIESMPVAGGLQSLLAAPNGIIVGDFGAKTVNSGGSGDGVGMIVQPDGKIVVCGTKQENNIPVFALARYSSYGSLDTSFDFDGEVTSNNGITGMSLAQQGDGKILMAGYHGIARYNTNGSLDSSFDSDGKVSLGFFSGIESMQVQSDGKILVAGSWLSLTPSDPGLDPFLKASLQRYTSEGSLDTSFDIDGKVSIGFGGGSIGKVHKIITQADGKILVCASVHFDLGNHYEIGMLRYNIDGSLDTSFDLDGKLTSDINGGSGGYFRGFALQGDGKILVAGTTGMNVALMRYNPNGSLDTSFDIDGLAEVDFDTMVDGRGQSLGYSVAVQTDGKIIVAGTVATNWDINRTDFALVRFNPDGSLDNTFGSGGKVVTSIGVNAWAYNVLIQTDGKILVSGVSSEKYAEYVTLARYNTDGSLDTTFNGSAPPANQTFKGTNANEKFTSGAGNDTIDGGQGTDTAQYNTSRSNFTVEKNSNGYTVTDKTGAAGTDTLTNIERLQFSDKKLALDLDPSQHTGQALEFIGLMAPILIKTPSVVGTILSLFDQGKSLHDVCQLALDVGLVNSTAGSTSNASLAAMAFRNVIGSEADAATVNMLVGYMDGRYASYSQADFMTVIAGMEVNQMHIGLIGLQQTGVEYN